MMKRFILLLYCMLPPLALACIPTRQEPFYSAATYLPDAVVGRFSPGDNRLDFIVTSSLRGTIKPGRYSLMVEGPFGPPDNRPGAMPCPSWKYTPLQRMPDNADTAQTLALPGQDAKSNPDTGQTWVLLPRGVKDGALQLSLDDDYAAQRDKTRLVSRVIREGGVIMTVNEKQFVRWFKARPANADSSSPDLRMAQQAELEKWRNATPAWKKTNPQQPTEKDR